MLQKQSVCNARFVHGAGDRVHSSVSRTKQVLLLLMAKVARLAPDKRHVFLFSIVDDESSNVHAKIFSDVHFGAENLEC